MPDFFSSKGITHQHSCVETPQQNSVVERNISTYLMLLDLYVSNQIYLSNFGEIVSRQQFISSIDCLVQFLSNKSPYEALLHKVPNILI
jgi:hypothetical protein